MAFDYSKLSTENTNAFSSRLDEMNPLEIVSLMNTADADVSAKVREALPDIATAVAEIAPRFASGGRLFYLGAGTSGRLGVLDASECPPTFGLPADRVIGLIAGGDGALRTAVEGAEDNAVLAADDLAKYELNENDSVMAISASGTAKYCEGALRYARSKCALCLSLCCNLNAPLSKFADIAICVDTGAEILAGSTRLRAGTATKMVLNMISTGVMVLSGKCYRNLMVDMAPTNIKLRDRAVRIVMKACSIDRETAEKCFADAGDDIKRAIIMHETNVNKDIAAQALEEAQGFTGRAIRSIKSK